VRAPRELPGVSVTAVAHGFPLELITNRFLIIQPFDRVAAKVLGHVTSVDGSFRALSNCCTWPDRREWMPKTFSERERQFVRVLVSN